MGKQHILLSLMLCLLFLPAMAWAQDELASAQPNERVRIQPQGSKVPTPAPIERIPQPVRHLWGDLDNDGMEDLFVLDQGGNLLFRNLKEKGFEEVTASAFPNGAGGSGAGFFGDYNGDGFLDIFLFDKEGFTLWCNDGKLRFSDVTNTLGLPMDLMGCQVQLKDYNNDGFQDILVQAPDGDRIFRNSKGREFSEVVPGNRFGKRSKIPAMKSPMGPSAPTIGWSASLTMDGKYVNDNSPGSVGIGVPEVEGGDDGSKLNDIVDGTITGADIMNDSVPPSKVTGTAATLSGIQNFDSGTLYIDASNNRVGMGTTTPSSSRLHITSSTTYGCRVENKNGSGIAVYGTAPDTGVQGYSTETSGYNHGVRGVSDSTDGNGVLGEATATTGAPRGVRGKSAGKFGIGVLGEATHTTGINYGVWGESASATGRGVIGYSTPTTGDTYGVYGWTNSTTGRAIYGRSNADSGVSYGVYGKSDSNEGAGVYGYTDSGTGITYGVWGETESTNGRGVMGYALSTSGSSFGVLGGCKSTTGTAVSGFAEATSGTCTGVQGRTFSTSGRGVYGLNQAGSGINYGVYALNTSTSGRGVYGYASASTGTTYGVKGHATSPSGFGVYGSSQNIGVEGLCTSTYGSGVYGYADATTGYTNGVFGESDSEDGYGVAGTSPFIGVYGTTSGSSGYKHGVSGVSSSSSGRGVSGTANSSTGTTYGVYGISYSTSGRGVYGEATASTGTNYGVRGRAQSTSGRAIYGSAIATTGVNYGVRGHSNSSSGYGVYAVGDMGCSGVKTFVQPHPHDASKEIRFVCLEGNESGTYFRGSSQIKGGRAIIDVPEEFRLVTESENLTVQCTPLGPAQLWVEKKGLDRIVVRGDMDVKFDYFVNGVRRGFKDIDLVRENYEWVPKYKDQPFGMQYPEALRQILVENGILNPDFTPNMKTAAKMGWELIDKEDETDLARLKELKSPSVKPNRDIYEKQERSPPTITPIKLAPRKRQKDEAAPPR